MQWLELVLVGFVTLPFPGSSGCPLSPAWGGAAGTLAEDKTNPDGRSGFRYVTVQRRKALKSSSLYRTARDGTLQRGRRRGWCLSSVSRVFRPLGDRVFSNSHLGETWNSSFTADGGHRRFPAPRGAGNCCITPALQHFSSLWHIQLV